MVSGFHFVQLDEKSKQKNQENLMLPHTMSTPARAKFSGQRTFLFTANIQLLLFKMIFTE